MQAASTRTCLKQHEAELSQACKARLEARAKAKQEGKATDKKAEDSAKMGKDEGTHTSPTTARPGKMIRARSINASNEAPKE
jgi:hypothetical protein